MALFLDTSFVIALEMARDNQHKAAAGYWAGYIQNPQAVAGNVREATNDLGTLRAEMDASLREVEQLVNEINRKWPFKRDMEIKLP